MKKTLIVFFSLLISQGLSGYSSLKKTTTQNNINKKTSIEKKINKTIPKVSPVPKIESSYTSLIIDCTEMGLSKSMSPLLVGEMGDEIYPGNFADQIDIHAILEGKLFNYEKGLKKAKMNPLAGNKPYIIRAAGIAGNFNSNPILNRHDSIKMMMANLDSNFLKNKKVIIAY